jgi:hypothetical protein
MRRPVIRTFTQELMQRTENPLISLVVNIMIPVLVLNKASSHLGPNGALWALLLALSFPLVYGLRDYFIFKNKNYVSILGVVNACLTGGIALHQLDGSWFALKDATLPICLGVYVLVSSFTKKPFAKIFFMNPQIMKVDVLQNALAEKGTETQFDSLLRKGTRLFAISFFLSGVLNFFLALRVFTPIDPALAAPARSQVLNEQIAHMTWLSMAVIALPLFCFTGAFLFWFFRRLSALTGLKVDQLTVD